MSNSSKREALIIAVCAAFEAALYAVCFSGFNILPQVSFTVFCVATFALLTAALFYLRRFKNRRALWWALPISALALMNAVFDANPFTWGNALAAHALFAVYILTATSAQPINLYCFDGALTAARQVLGGWTKFVGIAGLLFSSGPRNGAVTADGAGAANGSNGAAAAESNEAAESNGRRRQITGVLLGVLIAAPVLFIISALLVSADAVFGRFVDGILGAALRLEWLNPNFIITLVAVWIYASGYIYLSDRLNSGLKPGLKLGLKPGPTVCVTFLVLINALFIAFTFIQFAFLFNGGFLTLPADITYAQYAREGFFQLLAVTCINFSIIVVFNTVIEGALEHKTIRWLLCALCAFTGVLIVSSFYRMGLYTGAYGHTTLRLAVYTFLVMESVLLAVTLRKLSGGNVRFIRAYALVGLAFYIIVNITASDYMAARLNRALFVSGRLDYIDVYPVGRDGMTALKPLFEDDAYICIDYSLLRAEDMPSHMDINSRRFRYGDFVRYYGAEHWQNWSWIKGR